MQQKNLWGTCYVLSLALVGQEISLQAVSRQIRLWLELTSEGLNTYNKHLNGSMMKVILIVGLTSIKQVCISELPLEVYYYGVYLLSADTNNNRKRMKKD